MRESIIIVTGTLAIALGGCTASTPESAPVPTVTATVTTEPTMTATTATPTPTPDPEVGTELDTAGGGTAAVLAYEQPAATDAPQPDDSGYPAGLVWGALDVRVCVPDRPPSEVYPDEDFAAEDDGYTVSTQPWALTYEDGSVVASSHTLYTQFPQPEYPDGLPVGLGQCVRGWIVFPVPEDAAPVGVQYALYGVAQPLTWQIVTS